MGAVTQEATEDDPSVAEIGGNGTNIDANTSIASLESRRMFRLRHHRESAVCIEVCKESIGNFNAVNAYTEHVCNKSSKSTANRTQAFVIG